LSPDQHTQIVKQSAARLGFDYCGVAKCKYLEDDARRLEKWLGASMQGEMSYMENYFDLRVDPRQLVPGAKSVITLLLNYFPPITQADPTPKIAKYAYGQDYHEVIRKKLKQLMALMQEQVGAVEGRGFVDSAPVLERTWAQLSGLGWIGKNGNLINKQSGSFFFIATLIVDLDMTYDNPYAKDYCGTCTRCVDACPTDAILDNKVVDGSKCISYFTIELKDALIPEAMKGKFGNWLFGCDVCQDVCPWNRFSTATKEIGFTPLPEILNLSTSEWEELTEESFKKIFRHSPLQRAAYKGIKRNLKFIQS
jgi:epoxyqueuosine reductase